MKLENPRGIADCYNNIGVVYDEKRDNVNALKYFLKSLDIREKLGDQGGLADSYTNIGFMFSLQSNSELRRMGINSINRYSKALEYYYRALKIYQTLGEEKGVAIVYINIGKLENQRNNFAAGINWCKKGLHVAENIGALGQQVEACGCIYEGYKGNKDGMSSLAFFEKYIAMRDTLLNEEQEKKMLLNEFQYVYDKKASEDSILNAELQKRKDLEISRQKAIAEESLAVADKERIQKYMLWGGVSVGLIFSLFIYNRLRIIRKQSSIIEKQKMEDPYDLEPGTRPRSGDRGSGLHQWGAVRFCG
jgi:tetratricopeptide (TPR) repeat protein